MVEHSLVLGLLTFALASAVRDVSKSQRLIVEAGATVQLADNITAFASPTKQLRPALGKGGARTQGCRLVADDVVDNETCTVGKAFESVFKKMEFKTYFMDVEHDPEEICVLKRFMREEGCMILEESSREDPVVKSHSEVLPFDHAASTVLSTESNAFLACKQYTLCVAPDHIGFRLELDTVDSIAERRAVMLNAEDIACEDRLEEDPFTFEALELIWREEWHWRVLPSTRVMPSRVPDWIGNRQASWDERVEAAISSARQRELAAALIDAREVGLPPHTIAGSRDVGVKATDALKAALAFQRANDTRHMG